jgi:hypothetical protein
MLPDRENEIIALVTYIHHKVGFRDPPFSFLDFCAAFPNYEFHPASLPRGFNGEILIKGPHRIVRYRAGSKPNTNRFSIGHEIGHGFLHEEEEFQCKVSASFSLFKKPAGSAKEWEADFFSSELLMPVPVLNRMVGDLDAMSEEEVHREVGRQAVLFGVTLATMRTRLADLQRLRHWEGEFL